MSNPQIVQGGTRIIQSTGTDAPSIDEWEIYRGPLVDSGSLGGFGLEGWKVTKLDTLPGGMANYEVVCPPDAEIETDYQARIEYGSGGGGDVTYTYLYSPTNRPSVGSMLPGPLLGDGDANTGYEATDQDTPPPHDCVVVIPTQEVEAYLTGAWIPSQERVVTAVTLKLLAKTEKISPFGPGGLCSQCSSIPEDPFRNDIVLTYALEYLSGGVWSSLQSGTVANSATVQTVNWTGTQTCDGLRVVVRAYWLEDAESTCDDKVTARVNEITVTSSEGAGSSGTHSFYFDVIEAGTMPEDNQNPTVFQQFRLGPENTKGTAVRPNRRSTLLGMTRPRPITPSEVVFTQGFRGATETIRQKEHTESRISGPLGFYDMLYIFSSCLKTPVVVTPSGATTARDVYFRWRIDADDPFQTFTMEAGSEDFPCRFPYANITSMTLTFGVRTNALDANVVGRRLNDKLASFSGTPEFIPSVPIVAKDNQHYVGTAVSALGTVSQICDTQEVILTWGPRRTPHFTQCTGTDDSFTVMMPQQEAEFMATMTLNHRSVSRGFLDNLRSNDLLYYRMLNRGPQIEPGFFHELEITLPFKFNERDNGDTEGSATGIYQMRPNYEKNFNPNSIGTPATGGYGEIRLRVPATYATMAVATDL